MASRKSCTHLTWAEAKGKAGSSSTSNSKATGNVKRENHGKLLAAKIVAKAGPSEAEKIQNRQAARMARRDQQRQEQLEAQRQAEKERQRLEKIARPHEQALEKMEELAVAYKLKEKSSTSIGTDIDTDTNDSSIICESKQLQMDELLALQAMYVDNPDTLVVADASRLEDLQNRLEEWQSDPSLESSLVHHPALRIVLKRSVDDPTDDDWVAHCLVEVVFPNNYPLVTTPPHIRVEWFLLTKKSIVVSDNKPLESLGILDEVALLQALTQEAQELIGMPCLYELLDTWWSENLFQYISLNPII